MSPRRFPFGQEPVLVRAPEEPPSKSSAEQTVPLAPLAEQTVPLAAFLPPSRALPFSPVLVPAPPASAPAPAQSRTSFRTAAALVLLALDLLVLGYLFATWGH